MILSPAQGGRSLTCWTISLAALVLVQAAAVLLVYHLSFEQLVILGCACLVGLLFLMPIPVLLGIFIFAGFLFPFTGLRQRFVLGGMAGLSTVIVFRDYSRLALRSLLFPERTVMDVPVCFFLASVLMGIILGIAGGATFRQWPIEAFPYLYIGLVPIFIRYLCDRSVTLIFALLALALAVESLFGIVYFAQNGFVRLLDARFSIYPGLCAVVLLSFAVLHTGRKTRIVSSALILPMMLQLLASMTRGYWLGFLAGGIVVYIAAARELDPPAFRSLAAKTLAALLITLTALVFGLSRMGVEDPFGALLERFLTFSNLGRDLSTKVRLTEWKLAFAEFARRPVFGNGFGFQLNFFHPLYMKREGGWWFIHNNYLLLLVKIGIIGLAAFLSIVVVYFRNVRRGIADVTNPTARCLVIGFAANIVQFLVIATTNFTFDKALSISYFIFALGASLGILRDARRRQAAKRPVPVE